MFSWNNEGDKYIEINPHFYIEDALNGQLLFWLLESVSSPSVEIPKIWVWLNLLLGFIKFLAKKEKEKKETQFLSFVLVNVLWNYHLLDI